MQKLKVSFIERKFNYFVSVEKVFRLVDQALDKDRFVTSFRQLEFLNTLIGIVRNLFSFRPDRDADIHHVTGHCHYIALRLPPERTVLTIHDLGFLHTRTGVRRWLIKKLFLDLPVRRLRYITAISEATKREIEANCPQAAGKVRVIEDPVDPLFECEQKLPFNSVCPNLLQVGTSPNKNVVRVTRALAGIRCRLTLIGEIDERLGRELRESGINFAARTGLSAEDLKAEYLAADVLLFCSTYEGFGLPIVEAQSMRTPVVTSSISPMKEVAGDAAVFADPFDVGSMRSSIEQVISDSDLRDRLADAGVRNIERFKPERIAAKYAELYEEVARLAKA